jgi:hypothetical protein
MKIKAMVSTYYFPVSCSIKLQHQQHTVIDVQHNTIVLYFFNIVRRVSGFIHARGILRKYLMNVLFLECDQNGITHFGMCPFWNMIKMEWALFVMCSKWNVSFLECNLLGMWNVPLVLECDQNGIYPFRNVIKMKYGLFGMLSSFL